jgi:hypothetical protein
MRGLELDGIHDDGEHLVLRDDDGQTYTVLIDEALRAAVRRDRPALGMLQGNGTTPLRPREIQAMLRAGRSAEEIAEIAAVDVEHVRRYEGPVLAEREYLAQQARRYRMGRGDGRVLGEVVSERLAARHALEETRWDAWRRDDGTWTLELAFRAGGRERDAHWVVDITRESAEADDDEARWLTLDDDGDRPLPSRGRLTALRSAVYDQEADDDTPSGAAHTSRWGRDRAAGIDEDSLDALNARRGLRPVPGDDTWSTLDEDEHEQTPDSPASADTAPTRPVVPFSGSSRGEVTGSSAPSPADEDLFPHVPASDQEPDSAASARMQHPAGGLVRESDEATEQYSDTVDLTPLPGFDDARSTSSDPDDTPAQEHPTTSSTSGGSKSGRSGSKRQSMPSWDEIVFGPKHD